MGCPSMQRVPNPGESRRALSSFCMLASEGASSLEDTHTRRQMGCVCVCVVRLTQMLWVLPDEGDLVLVHPRLQLQTGILPERGNDETEDEGNADKDRRKDDLHTQST